MPLSTEEEARLNVLQGKIEALEKEIHDYKAGAGVLTDKDKDYLIPLNNRLTGYEAEARELRSKASGKWLHSFISSIASTDTFLFAVIVILIVPNGILTQFFCNLFSRS